MIRELIRSITVHKFHKVDGGGDDCEAIGIEVEGYLAPFLRQDGKPMNSVECHGGDGVGSGGGIRTPDTRIMIPLL